MPGMEKPACALAIILLLGLPAGPCQAYHNDRYDFSIDPPGGWITASFSGAAVVFIGPTDYGSVNINIVVVKVPASTDVEARSKQSIAEILAAFPDDEILSEGRRTVNGMPAYEVVWRAMLGNLTFIQKQVAVIKGTQGFIITYTGDEDTYYRYMDDFESSLETFKPEKSPPKALGPSEAAAIVFVAAACAAIPAAAVILIRRRKRLAAQMPAAWQSTAPQHYPQPAPTAGPQPQQSPENRQVQWPR